MKEYILLYTLLCIFLFACIFGKFSATEAVFLYKVFSSNDAFFHRRIDLPAWNHETPRLQRRNKPANLIYCPNKNILNDLQIDQANNFSCQNINSTTVLYFIRKRVAIFTDTFNEIKNIMKIFLVLSLFSKSNASYWPPKIEKKPFRNVTTDYRHIELFRLYPDKMNFEIADRICSEAGMYLPDPMDANESIAIFRNESNHPITQMMNTGKFLRIFFSEKSKI